VGAWRLGDHWVAVMDASGAIILLLASLNYKVRSNSSSIRRMAQELRNKALANFDLKQPS
jgi:HAMP domain-containing protein